MTDTYIISRSTEHDRYTTWAFDRSSPELLTKLPTDPDSSFPRHHNLTAVGGFLLASSPLDRALQQFEFCLFAFDPHSDDPLNARPVQAGLWDKEKFWDYYEYRDHPGAHQVTDLQLIGAGGYVLSFLPTAGRGSFNLWNFDATADNPGGAQDPLIAIGGPGAFPDIGMGHTLLPVNNYVIDWVPEQGTYNVYSFDPQLANPLSQPVISSGQVPTSEGGDDRVVVVGEDILVWSRATRTFTLYRFDPVQPFSDVVQSGTLPQDFDDTNVLASVQTTLSQLSAHERPADADVPGTMAFMQDRIEHVVYYVLESRSFDSVVGWLHEQGTEGVNWIHAEAPFQGASESNSNRSGSEEYHQHKVHHGDVTVDKYLREPMLDPFHDTPDSIRQQWSGGYEAYQNGDPADMQGFVSNNGFKAVMGGYTPEQLPVLNGLAKHFAVSDEWFCSEAGGTTTNRATMASGSAFNITASYESGPAYTNFPDTPHRQSLWKVLSNNGIDDWRIFYSVEWGTPPYPYTYHLYLRGQVPSVDGSWSRYVQPIRSFMKAAEKDELPAFSFLEPVWFEPSGEFTSYHPTGDVIPGEVALNDIYEAIKNGPGWDKTVLVVSFSKGGGLYDHVPSPPLQKAWPNDGNDGYNFDTAGTRVPTIVVSPFVKPNTVFRSGSETPFDSTSLAATVLRWFGVPEARWGLGDRVPLAPTIETVLQEQHPRRDAPTLGRSFDMAYPPHVKVHTDPTTKAHWHAKPGTGSWTRRANWRTGVVPTGKATFLDSTQDIITFKKGSRSTVEQIRFVGSSTSYRFVFTEAQPDLPILAITGKGVVNESGQPQTFAVTATSLETTQAQLVFANRSSAGGDDVFYSAGPRRPTGRSGGIISFNHQSRAGSAHFEVFTGSKPTQGTTVGAEIRFNDNSSAHEGTFIAHGTTGTDGDTFGNVVFHDNARAHQARFTNLGGTVSQGDGGNTQFFDTTSAGTAKIVNKGGTHYLANGGDVAFDNTATAHHARIINQAAKAEGAYGGVTSFNNNWPPMAVSEGASAGHAVIENQGAGTHGHHGGGGHTKFSGMYGAGHGGHANITNRGTSVACSTGAGNTQFTISGKAEQPWRPSAGHATIVNHPGACDGARAGYTTFACYDFIGPIPPGPTAGHATITSLGATSPDAPGGATKFTGTSTAGHATLVANGGSNGGWAGSIEFADAADGDEATIELDGGDLDINYSDLEQLSIGALTISDGTIGCQVGEGATTLVVAGELTVVSPTMYFRFTRSTTGFEPGVEYRLMKADGLRSLSADRFTGSSIDDMDAHFHIDGDELFVSFSDR